MYRARDQVENEEWIDAIEDAAETLDLTETATSRATDVFLTNVPDEDRSKQAILAASIYVGALVAGDQRSQGQVAEATDVSRLTVQQHWKELLETAGFDAPDW
ncbi:transcription initiation factor IIB family protein [Halorhabdus sp. CUG00001]|uniref:transcription initiation factor IIB family protein n=1 Tax=Halorhabdus sp. CUG00001 TaxID=2600297 RepID=UPI00131A6A18|nr:transcription initiation factor IIB family protein [Halorhabdus sp. CUG00001]